MTKVYEPKSPHIHSTGQPAHNFPFNSVARCADCGRWMFVATVYGAMHPRYRKKWLPVKWYHMGLNARIYKIEKEERRK